MLIRHACQHVNIYAAVVCLKQPNLARGLLRNEKLASGHAQIVKTRETTNITCECKNKNMIHITIQVRKDVRTVASTDWMNRVSQP